jgi:hypothetical protein
MRRRLVWVFLIVLVFVTVIISREENEPDTGADQPPLSLFPTGYDASRARFQATCRQMAAGRAAECRSFAIESATEKDLTIDTAYFSRGNPKLLIVQSGIHGAEAYAGAAVQQLLMGAYLDRLLDRGFDILLVHALNPYGFRHDRRTDEANVNLNRNFVTDVSVFTGDSHDYAALRGIFEPDGPVGSPVLGSLRARLALLWVFVSSGFDARPISAAMNSGQYRFAEGLNYGGAAHQPQVEFLRAQVAVIMAAHSGDILFLDFHTGLGEVGVLHVITGIRPAPRLFRRLRDLLAPLHGAGLTFSTPDDPGFYPTAGDVIDFVPSLAADPDRVLAVTMEYGTRGTGTLAELTTASRMILENQAHFRGCISEAACSEVREDFRELFNPTDPGWRHGVLREADLVLSVLAQNF